MTWAPPTSGGSPTSYNVSINDIIGTTRSISHDGSPSYTLMFPGLTSNTLYSVTVVAINCAGSSSNATLNNYTRKLIWVMFKGKVAPYLWRGGGIDALDWKSYNYSTL